MGAESTQLGVHKSPRNISTCFCYIWNQFSWWRYILCRTPTPTPAPSQKIRANTLSNQCHTAWAPEGRKRTKSSRSEGPKAGGPSRGPSEGPFVGPSEGPFVGLSGGFVRGGVRTRSQTPEGPELLVLYIFKTQIFQILLRYLTYLRIWDQSLPCEHCTLWCGADSRLRDWERAPLMARTANLAQPIRKCLKRFQQISLKLYFLNWRFYCPPTDHTWTWNLQENIPYIIYHVCTILNHPTTKIPNSSAALLRIFFCFLFWFWENKLNFREILDF